MISQTAEYALRAIVYLADQQVAQTTAQIATATLVPAGYLAKVMQVLVRAKLVSAQRGVGGGFRLNSDIESLTVLAIINAVDPLRRYHECPLGLHGTQLCPLHRTLDDAAQALEVSFAQTSVGDLLRAPREQNPLCMFPEAAQPTNRAADQSLP